MPKAGATSRVAFAGVTYAFATVMLSTTLPTPLYVLYRQRFGFSELTITVIFATYAAGVIAALLLFGRISDEIGRRLTLLPGLALAAVSSAVFLLAQGLGALLVARLLSGLSAGIFTGTATATLVDLAPPRRRERASLIATLANMAGLGLGPLLAGVLVQWAALKLRLVYWVDLALLVPGALAIWWMREPVAVVGSLRLRLQGLTVPSEMRDTFRRSALAAFAGFAVLGLFTSVSPAFLAGVLDVQSHFVLGVVVCAVFAASTAGQLALPRFGSERALPAGCVGLIAGMGGLAWGLAASSLALLVVGGVVAGFGQGLSFRAGLAAVNAEAPAEGRAAVASSFFVVAYVAISIPVIGEGLLAEAIGLRAAGLVFAGCVALIATCVLALLAGARPGSPAAARPAVGSQRQ